MPEMGTKPEMGVGEMPAETIHGINTPIDTRVSWGLDCGYVQIATLHKDGGRVIVGYVSDWLEAAGRPRIDWDELVKAVRESQTDTGGAIAFDGMHASLDHRSSINDLIRVLRKSRDQAFGKDE